MQAVILAAGRGTRLQPLTDATPKALVDIGGETLLEHLLLALPKEIHEIIIVVGHLGDHIEKRIGSAWHGKAVCYVTQSTLDGTGSALHLVKDLIHGTFLVVNGDDLYGAPDLSRLIAHPLAILLSLSDTPVEHAALVGTDGRFMGLETRPPMSEPQRRVCGAYVLDERFFKYPLAKIPVRDHQEFSLPHTLVELAKDAVVRIEFADYWRPVGTAAELERVRTEVLTGRV